MLSPAEALRRSLNRAAQQGEDLCLSLGHAARSQKLPPAVLARFLIAAEGGSLAKELHRAKIDATPCGCHAAPCTNPTRSVPGSLYTFQCLKRIWAAPERLQRLPCPRRGWNGH